MAAHPTQTAEAEHLESHAAHGLASRQARWYPSRHQGQRPQTRAKSVMVMVAVPSE
jgi:hypothetical protein